MTDMIEDAPWKGSGGANRKRPTSVVTGPRRTPIEKVELIYALVAEPSDITPSLLRIKILAICEGRVIPADRKAFIALALRAGVSKAKCYTAWQEWRGELPGATAVVSEREPDEDALTDDGTQDTALYRYFDADDLPLYAGISDHLHDRTRSHIKGSSWMDFAVRSTIERHPTRAIALDVEEVAIKAERPIFNRQHNDTPEARRRVVEYLIKHDRLDLLVPAASRG